MRSPRSLDFSSCPIPIPCPQFSDSPAFHSPYTLPSSVARKSFACYSYENCRGVGVFFPFRNSPFATTHPPLSPVESAHPDKHRVFPVFSRNRPPSSPLEATLTRMPISVASKGFTGTLSPLESALTKKPGRGGIAATQPSRRREALGPLRVSYSLSFLLAVACFALCNSMTSAPFSELPSSHLLKKSPRATIT